jgi:hypothetical protein
MLIRAVSAIGENSHKIVSATTVYGKYEKYNSDMLVYGGSFK